LTPDEIVTASMIADMCGVTAPAISNWQSRDVTKVQLPEPWAILGDRCKLWYRGDIEVFVADRQADALRQAEKLRRSAEAMLRRADQIEKAQIGA
jgi:hypothetical protein